MSFQKFCKSVVFVLKYQHTLWLFSYILIYSSHIGILSCLITVLYCSSASLLIFITLHKLSYIPSHVHILLVLTFFYAASESNTLKTLIEAVPKILNWYKCFMKVEQMTCTAVFYIHCWGSLNDHKNFRSPQSCTMVMNTPLIFVELEPVVIPIWHSSISFQRFQAMINHSIEPFCF